MNRQHTQHYLCALMVGSWLAGAGSFVGAHETHTPSEFVHELRHAQAPPLALVTWSESEVSFAPLEAAVQLRLRITGPDYVYEERSEGEGLVFQALEDDGGFLPDGVYRYELVEIPQLAVVQKDALAEEHDPEVLRALKRQWRRDGVWPPPRPRVQQAVFRIEAGQIIAPE